MPMVFRFKSLIIFAYDDRLMSVQSVTMARINHEKVIWTLIATCLVLIGGVDGGITLTDLEIRRQLKQLNKPAVKSFKVVFWFQHLCSHL